MTPISFVVPIKTERGLNNRGHWRVAALRVDREKKATKTAWLVGVHVRREEFKAIKPPVHVHLTRLSPRGPLLDDDNNQGALKTIRDTIAQLLGVDDGDKKAVRFTYGAARGEWGVRVEMSLLVAGTCLECGQRLPVCIRCEGAREMRVAVRGGHCLGASAGCQCECGPACGLKEKS